MTERRAPFRQTDATRAIRAILNAGLQIYAVRFLPKGGIEVSTSSGTDDAPASSILATLERAKSEKML